MTRIEEIAQRLGEATPGEWENEDYRSSGKDWRSCGVIWAKNKGYYHPGTAICRLECRELHSESPPEEIAQFEGNASFIANAPSDLQFLLDEVKRLSKECDLLQVPHFENDRRETERTLELRSAECAELEKSLKELGESHMLKQVEINQLCALIKDWLVHHDSLNKHGNLSIGEYNKLIDRARKLVGDGE